MLAFDYLASLLLQGHLFFFCCALAAGPFVFKLLSFCVSVLSLSVQLLFGDEMKLSYTLALICSHAAALVLVECIRSSLSRHCVPNKSQHIFLVLRAGVTGNLIAQKYYRGVHIS